MLQRRRSWSASPRSGRCWRRRWLWAGAASTPSSAAGLRRAERCRARAPRLRRCGGGRGAAGAPADRLVRPSR
eukprot:6818878-Lingulodinium_polyedra.AAC.1